MAIVLLLSDHWTGGLSKVTPGSPDCNHLEEEKYHKSPAIESQISVVVSPQLCLRVSATATGELPPL